MSKLDLSIIATDFKSQGVNVTYTFSALNSVHKYMTASLTFGYTKSLPTKSRMCTNKTRDKTSANKNTEFHITHPISYAQTVDINHTSIRHINTNIYTLV